MKNLLFTLLGVLSFSFAGNSQIGHDLEIYSIDGQKFYLTVNGRKLNETPMSNVQILNMNKDYVHAVVKFEDGSLGTIEKKNLGIATPSTEEAQKNKPVSVVYKIVEKKGKYKIRFASRSDKKIQPKEKVIVKEVHTKETVIVEKKQAQPVQQSNKFKLVINW